LYDKNHPKLQVTSLYSNKPELPNLSD